MNNDIYNHLQQHLTKLHPNSHHNWHICSYSNGAVQLHYKCYNVKLDICYIVRLTPNDPLPFSLSKKDELCWHRYFYDHAVKVARIVQQCDDGECDGFIMEYYHGESNGRIITMLNDTYKKGIAKDLAQQLAHIHTLPQPNFLENAACTSSNYLTHYINYYTNALQAIVPNPYEYIEIAHILKDKQPNVSSLLIPCHGDFRTGNYIVDDKKLHVILDMEFAHMGIALEDIGWFCSPIWRYNCNNLEAGGLVTTQQFLKYYNYYAHTNYSEHDLYYYQILAWFKWAVIAFYQQHRYYNGLDTHMTLHHYNDELQCYPKQILQMINDLL